MKKQDFGKVYTPEPFIRKKKGILARVKSRVRRLLRPLQQKRGLTAFMKNQKAAGEVYTDTEELVIKNNPVMDFINKAGHTDVNLTDLNKAKSLKK